MGKPRAFITRNLPEEALAIARSTAEIDVWPEPTPPSDAALAARLADADGVLCLLTDRIDDTLLSQAPRLRIVSQMAVGYDNIDVAACTRRGIPVGNTPGVLTETTADLAFGLLLMTARRLSEAETWLRAGRWKTWSPMELTGPDVHDATLGIVGMGRIGYEMARRAAGFQMKLLYHSRSRHEDVERDFGAERCSLDELLERSDFVSLHMPLSAETRHMIGAAQLAKMKPSAILINTARGSVLDQAALVDALQDWVDPDDDPRPNGAESVWYELAGRFAPRNDSLADLRELARVRGFEEPGRFDSVLTIEPGRVSLATASVPVLMAVPGITRETAEQIVELQHAGTPLASLLEITPVLSSRAASALEARYVDATRLTTADPDAWLVRVRAAHGFPSVAVQLEWRVIRTGRQCAVARTRSST